MKRPNTRNIALLLLLGASLGLGACEEMPAQSSTTGYGITHATSAAQPTPSRPGEDGMPDKADIPPNIAELPDAVPRYEKRSVFGNPDSYEVYGERYVVLNDFSGFKQRGIASWYGKKFHGKNTSSGEPYDMFLMTAAHKTLPIPCYVRVTNLDNHKSAIVRVNDRGPFHSDRIIDLSYVAALKLGIIGEGSARVEIEALTPPEPGSPSPMLTAQAPVSATTTLPPKTAVDAKPALIAQSAPQSAATSANAATLAAIATGSSSASASVPVFTGPDARWLQAGVFLDPLNAATLRDQLNAMGVGNVEIKVQPRAGKSMHRVLIGPFTDIASRDAVRTHLASVQLVSMPVPN